VIALEVETEGTESDDETKNNNRQGIEGIILKCYVSGIRLNISWVVVC
jgi:hypothetical protein